MDAKNLIINFGLPAAFGAVLGLAAFFYNKHYANKDSALLLESAVIALITGVLMWFVVRSVSGMSGSM